MLTLRDSETPISTPFVSVIMPIRNERGYIERSLGTVLAQDYAHDRYEVLVADGMSTDNTRVIVGQLATKSDVEVKIVDNPERIVPTGFNRALALSRGDIIIRVDGHCEIPPNYLTQCLYYLDETGAECVGGVIDTIGETFVASAVAIAMSSFFGVGDSAFRTTNGDAEVIKEVDTLAFGAYRREVFNTIGDFDIELVRNQDDEFNYRLRKAGGRIVMISSIKALYYSRASIGKLWRQYYQYGLYKIRVLQKHAQQMQVRQFIPPLFAAGLIGGLVVAPFSDLLRTLWLAGIFIYLVVDLLVSLRIAARAGIRYLPIVAIVFPILHLSYGAGFIQGLWKFRKRWREKAP